MLIAHSKKHRLPESYSHGLDHEAVLRRLNIIGFFVSSQAAKYFVDKFPK
jgi:hypothetical protein